jgi:myo-inositol-1(or 4)-monophosphatase
MESIDTAICAALLRGVTDQLQSSISAPAAGADTVSLIRTVLQASAWAERTLQSALRAQFPEVAWSDAEFDLERQRSPQTAGSYWVYDPIDGAYHFAQGLPLWSSSLAMVDAGKPAHSFVYDPAQKEMFSASTGEGARLNGIIQRPPGKAELASAVVGTAVAPLRGPEGATVPRALRSIEKVAGKVFVVRMMASASLQLAYVAAGRLDAYWEFGRDLYDWMAGSHLVSEAGATVTDCAGHAFTFGADGVLASSTHLHASLLDTINASN